MTYVPPYNDPFVIGGQGTIAMELIEQLPDLDAVFVAVGGGGLIGGIASYLKAVKPDVSGLWLFAREFAGDGPVGGRPANCSTCLRCPRSRTAPPAALRPAPSPFRSAVTSWIDYISVSEEEIATSLREFMGAQHMLIEGSAAVPIAAFLKVADQLAGKARCHCALRGEYQPGDVEGDSVAHDVAQRATLRAGNWASCTTSD